MKFTYRALLAAGTVTALLVSGCTRDVAGTAVTAAGGEDAASLSGNCARAKSMASRTSASSGPRRA